jgi:hypothetical protein
MKLTVPTLDLLDPTVRGAFESLLAQLNRPFDSVQLLDGVATPTTENGKAKIYVDAADGDLKVRFGDGTVKLIVSDT